MDENKPRRRWYRKRRWWAAGAIWLLAVLAASPFLVGPLVYLEAHGVLPGWCARAADAAVFPVVAMTPFHHDYANYVDWWFNRALNERLAEAIRENPDATDIEF